MVKASATPANPPASSGTPERPTGRPAYGGIGSVTSRSEGDSSSYRSAESPSTTTAAPVPPQVQPARQPFVENPAEELDVPDFLK